MRQFITLFILTLMVVACDSESSKFKLKGRFRNFNQGEFYIYAEGAQGYGMDTIKVADGRFSYSKEVKMPTTMVMVFPNFSTQPVFAIPGKEVEMKVDASHLKEMEITGTEDNELMTLFRKRTAEMTPPERNREIEKVVKEHPSSPVALWIVERWMIKDQTPDYATAARLMNIMIKGGNNETQLKKNIKAINELKKIEKGQLLPNFSAKDINGKKVNRKTLSAKVNVVAAWASWNYNSRDAQRRLNKLKKQMGDTLAIIGICLDANKEECLKWMRRDSVKWPQVCDGKMWQGQLATQMAVHTVGANIIADSKGKIVARDVAPQDLEKKIKELLRK